MDGSALAALGPKELRKTSSGREIGSTTERARLMRRLRLSAAVGLLVILIGLLTLAVFQIGFSGAGPQSTVATASAVYGDTNAAFGQSGEAVTSLTGEAGVLEFDPRPASLSYLPRSAGGLYDFGG